MCVDSRKAGDFELPRLFDPHLLEEAHSLCIKNISLFKNPLIFTWGDAYDPQELPLSLGIDLGPKIRVTNNQVRFRETNVKSDP